MKKLKFISLSMVSRLGIKLSLLILVITVAADVLSFTSRIVIDMVFSNGSTDTENVIASIVSRIVIGNKAGFRG